MTIPTHVRQAFIERLLAVFGPPASDDPEKFLTEYGRMLKGYATHELGEAADHLLRTHRGPQRWPRIADCIEACEDVRERQRHAKPRHSIEADWNAKASNAEALMMNTEIGQQAARDGWANGCREFVMRHARLPHEHEIGRLIDSAAFIDKCAAGEIDMGFMHDGLLRLAAQSVARRDIIAYRVVNGIAREGGA